MSKVLVLSPRSTELEPPLNREGETTDEAGRHRTAPCGRGLHWPGRRGKPGLDALLDQLVNFVINLNNIKLTR